MRASTKKIVARILIAEDHRLIRSGIRSLLEAAGAEIVGEASDGHEAVRLATALTPDVVLMDLSMPLLNGMEATRKIHDAVPSTRIVVLSMHTESKFIYEAMRAGASGYVLKDGVFEELIRAIRAALAHQKYLSPAVAKVAVQDYMQRAQEPPAPSQLEKLTTREREILQLIAEGKSRAEIADLLQIGPRSVDTYRTRMMDALGVHSIAGLTKVAIRNGLASLDGSAVRKTT